MIHNNLSSASFLLSKNDVSELAVSIVGFGVQGIDLSGLDCTSPDVVFSSYVPDNKTDESEITGPLIRCPHSCPHILPKSQRPSPDDSAVWKFSPDYFGLADMVHMMLFGGRPLEVTVTSTGKYIPMAFISNYTPHRRTWEEFFNFCLNPPHGTDLSPALSSIMQMLEAIVEEGSITSRVSMMDSLRGLIVRDPAVVASWRNIVDNECKGEDAAIYRPSRFVNHV